MNQTRVDTSLPRSSRPRRVALAGNPNVGKTTLFNLLTRTYQKVGNYPGVTVEKKVGRMAGPIPIEIIDLPGIYSLSPKSLDELVAHDVLAGRMNGEPLPDLVVSIVNSTNLERNLYLTTQIMDLGLPTIIALNMMDHAEESGLHIDVKALSETLGVPVIPMVASTGQGFDRLREAILSPTPIPGEQGWSMPPAVTPFVNNLSELFAREVPAMPARHRFSEAFRALSNDMILGYWEKRNPTIYKAVLATRSKLKDENIPYHQAEVSGRYFWLTPKISGLVTKTSESSSHVRSDRIDAVLTHHIIGPITFLLVLAFIFQSIFSWATPVMELIELSVTWFGGAIRSTFPPGVVTDLIVEGAVAGVGNVLVFLPQILLLFFFLGLMEDSGYMARTAFIMDKVMSRVGLNGGSVVPLVSSFACAVPGIMAARTMDNHRDRLITIMVAPLMSCSARLPVYTLFIAAFIPTGKLLGIWGYQGLAMFSLYILGTVMAFTAAWILKKYVLKGSSTFFAMELPPYRLPQMKQVLWRMGHRTKCFVTQAGKIIFLLSIILWFLASYPKVDPSPELEARREITALVYQSVLDSVAAANGVSSLRFLERDHVRQAMSLQAAIETNFSNVNLSVERLEDLQRRHPNDTEGALDISTAQQRYERSLSDIDAAEASYQIRHSFIGWMGRFIEPAMRPLGFDWKISAGIITAFAAREVIISALATFYSIGDADEDSIALRDHLKADRDPVTGKPVFTPLVAASLLVFFALALQCMSTLAVARRETNTWRWPALMWFYMTALAYLASLIVFQGGLALGLG